MKDNILVIGGSGFIGSAIVARLARRGFPITVPTRNREDARHLLVLPTVSVLVANVHDPAELARLCAGKSVVISCVGILQGGEGQPYGPGFARAHVQLPAKIAAAARAAGVDRIIHLSALQAASDGPSCYLRSKGDGDKALLAAQPDVAVTLLQPSVVFGVGDAFLNMFAKLLRTAPFFPLACADAQFQPVWVEDVARVVEACLDRPESRGQTYALGGPKVYSLRQLVEFCGAATGHPRPVIPLPSALGRLQAWALEHVPGKPMSRDNLRSMSLPSVCPGEPLPFGLVPAAMEAIAFRQP